MEQPPQEPPTAIDYASPAEARRVDPVAVVAVACGAAAPLMLLVGVASQFEFAMAPFAFTLLVLGPLSLILGIVRSRDQTRRYRATWMRVLAICLGGTQCALVLLGLFLMPSLGRAREPARRIKCASNMKQIGLAIQTYANENGGRFPPRLEELLLTGSLTSETFVCPSSTLERATGADVEAVVEDFANGGHLSYTYVGRGMTSTSSPGSVVLYETLQNHDGDGMNVLYADGQARFFDAATASRIVAELDAGHNPPRPERLR